MRRNLAAFSVLLLLTGPALAEGPSKARLGEKIPNVLFRDENGQARPRHLHPRAGPAEVPPRFSRPVVNGLLHEEYPPPRSEPREDVLGPAVHRAPAQVREHDQVRVRHPPGHLGSRE